MEGDLTPDEIKDFGLTMWPAIPALSRDELKNLLDSSFLGGPDDGDEEEEEEEMDYSDLLWKNFSEFSRKSGGFAWMNALYHFDGEDKPPVTPLIYLIENEPDGWRTISFLLSSGADPNVRDGKGRPPLYVCFLGGMMLRWKTFNALFESGANAFAVYKGKTMVQYSRELAKGPSEQVFSMIWDDIKRKHEIDESDFEDDLS